MQQRCSMGRKQIRYKLFWELEDYLKDSKGKKIVCNCVDLSENGMGIATQQAINEKEMVSLNLLGFIPLETIWCKKLSKESDFFYAGLRTIHPDDNLLTSFQEFGILSTVTPNYCETKDGTRYLADEKPED